MSGIEDIAKQLEEMGRLRVPDEPKPFKLPNLGPGLPHYLSGDASFSALRKAVDDLVNSAPADHDVLVEAFGISVTQVDYSEPHTFLLHGFDAQGNRTAVVAHFSQLVAHVVYLPKRGNERIITGFSPAGSKQA